jgi:hypothetical protein
MKTLTDTQLTNMALELWSIVSILRVVKEHVDFNLDPSVCKDKEAHIAMNDTSNCIAYVVPVVDRIAGELAEEGV